MSDVTQILSQVQQGEPSASERLLLAVYDELRKLAAAKLARETPGQTLSATALVHEAYLRLADTEDPRRSTAAVTSCRPLPRRCGLGETNLISADLLEFLGSKLQDQRRYTEAEDAYCEALGIRLALQNASVGPIDQEELDKVLLGWGDTASLTSAAPPSSSRWTE